MQLYAVNFIPPLSSLYMFRAAHAHHQEYNVQLYLQPLVHTIGRHRSSRLLSPSVAGQCQATLGESSCGDLCRYYGLHQWL
jgi:hypothetical protein